MPISPVMRRQLLTLLALLTGLAAFGAPATAAASVLFGEQVQADSEGKSEERRAECRERKDAELTPVRRESVKDCPPRKRIRIYVPTVMLGSDIATE